MRKRHEVVDRETGEIRPAIVVSRNYVKWSFVMWNQEAAGRMALDKRLVLSDWKIWGHLCSIADRAGVVSIVSQRVLSRDLDLTPSTVCNSFKRLVDCGYVALEAKGSNKEANVYRLNPDVAKRKA